MSDRYELPFEVHLHGQVSLRADVDFAQLQEALRPLWTYVGARSLSAAAASLYDDEPGIRFDAKSRVLQMCWTLAADNDFRQSLDDMCMDLNELAVEGAALEVTFYDMEFDEDDEGLDRQNGARDDFFMLFIGPTPAAIMAVQRDMLVQDVIHMMERHFDASELQGVVTEIDKLFSQRFDNLVSSLEIGRIAPRGGGGRGGSGGGGRRPRHLH